MKLFSLKFTILTLAGAIAMAPAARAASLSDDDEANQYSRGNQESYCYEHPYDDDCDPYKKRYDNDRHRSDSEERERCAALVRAVGKRNLVTAFARNSARFAWTREARYVHGDQYANWNYARNARIECISHGALKSCAAIATPCRY